MTDNEVRKLLMTIEAFYPQWKVTNPRETAAAWHWVLKDYQADAIMAALNKYIKTSNSGFAPSVSHLIGEYNKVPPRMAAAINDICKALEDKKGCLT